VNNGQRQFDVSCRFQFVKNLNKRTIRPQHEEALVFMCCARIVRLFESFSASNLELIDEGER
jgi:hypothetical protein